MALKGSQSIIFLNKTNVKQPSILALKTVITGFVNTVDATLGLSFANSNNSSRCYLSAKSRHTFDWENLPKNGSLTQGNGYHQTVITLFFSLHVEDVGIYTYLKE